MIVCTRCGAPNEESERFCAVCGHKLQSLRRPGPAERPLAETLRPLAEGVQGGKYRTLLLRCLEVWAVASSALGLTLWGISAGQWWPGALSVCLGGLYVYWRR